MAERPSISSAHPVEKEDSFVTALSFPRSTSTFTAGQKMFAITDTSPASPLIKRRPTLPNFKEQPHKKQFGTPNSCTSAITQSPTVSQSTNTGSVRTSRPHARVHFDAESTALSSGSATLDPSNIVSSAHDSIPEKQFVSTPKTSTSYIRNLRTSVVTPALQKRSKSAQTESLGEHEIITPESATDVFTYVKPRKSITDNFTPPPSRIPTRKRRTPGYARSTKASRRRSEMSSSLFLQSQRKRDNTSMPVTKIDFTKTVPKSPEVLHRKVRTRKDVSPRKRATFKAKPVPRYLTMPRPAVRPTAKSEAILHGSGHAAPKVPTFAQRKPSLTVPKPFKLGSVDLHEARMKKIHENRKADEEEAERRRIIRPVDLKREILEGPTFVPNLDKKNLTVPVDLLPWAAERRERTLAFEAAQRTRIEEMEALKKIAQRQRELAEEERLRDEYERKRFRPRPVPRSHYYPDTPPKRKASIAVMRIKEEIARRMEREEEELESVFSNLAVTEHQEKHSALTAREKMGDENAHSPAKLKTAEKVGIKNASLPTKETSQQLPFTAKESKESDSSLVHDSMSLKGVWGSDVDKENIMPAGTVRQKDRRKQGAQGVLGPLKLFNEIRNTLLGRVSEL